MEKFNDFQLLSTGNSRLVARRFTGMNKQLITGKTINPSQPISQFYLSPTHTRDNRLSTILHRDRRAEATGRWLAKPAFSSSSFHVLGIYRRKHILLLLPMMLAESKVWFQLSASVYNPPLNHRLPQVQFAFSGKPFRPDNNLERFIVFIL